MPDLLTADELLHLHIPDKRTELVRGVLVVREPPGGRHGRIAMNLGVELANYVRPRKLGVVYAAETGFTLARQPDPGTRRVPRAGTRSRRRGPLARVCRHDGTERIVAAEEKLDGEDIVPDFSCRLDAIL